MKTNHHLPGRSEQLISIVYEFAEKELKNKGDSVYKFKKYLLEQYVKALKEASAALNFSAHQLQVLTLAILIKILEYRDADVLCKGLSAETGLEKSVIDKALALIDNESAAEHALLTDICTSVYGKKSFFRYEAQLRNYLQAVKNEHYDDEHWLDYLDNKLRKQRYLSAYGQSTYTFGLGDNLVVLNKMKKKLDKKKDAWLERELKIDEKGLKELKKKYAKMVNRPERGIETLFRLTSKNHYTLNAMVDRKSNILISINAIILSIILGTLLGKINDDPHLIVPIFLILATNLASIVFAILATRPDKTHGNSSEPGFHHLLFYGNFKNMEEKSYVDGLNQLMGSADKLYNSIGRDIYYLGLNLDRKFGFLRVSFNIFMYGIILSVLTFLICHLFFAEVVG
ncbi:MAG: DUF5706 domain-containing protein [Cytophagales bacterium]|nr:DUF5706 domain-containing protein [Cytophagales bacterium]